MPTGATKDPPVTVVLIANPSAGSGRGRGAAIELARELQTRGSAAEIFWTERPGHAADLAENAGALGAKAVVAVGGDGTLGECATGIARHPVGPNRPALGLLPAGTGGDYRRTFRWDASARAAADRVLRAAHHPVDLGRYRLGGGTEGAFVNVLSFGVGGLTDQIVSGGPKWLGGRAAFFLGGVQATLAFDPIPVELVADGRAIEPALYRNVAVCLGRYFGGGMQVAPHADPGDGLFDVVLMSASRIRTLALALDIYRGTHLDRDGVQSFRCARLEAKTLRPGEVLVDSDGEQPGKLPIEIWLEPGGLHLLV
jgi:diacylglycerol kinase (ATP)